MPDQIIFRGAYVRRFSVQSSADGTAVFVKISLGCDFSKPLRDAMKWGELPEGFEQADLAGELNAQTMSMAPGDGLDKHAFDLPITVAENFQVLSLIVPDKPNRLEVRFQVKSASIKATRIIDDYFRTLGNKKGQLRISYTEEAPKKQGELPLDKDKQEELPLKGEAAAEHEEIRKGRKSKVN